MWAESKYSQLEVTVRGIQHFSKQPSKNSADITIALDAVTDFSSGKTQYVATMSDDSDFMAVYLKLKELIQGKPPFLWFVTDRDKTRSATIREYFPNEYIHVVSFPTKTRTQPKSPANSHKEGGDNAVHFNEMADLILEQIPVGSFKSTDCQPIIKKGWGEHPIARMPGNRFGTEFASKIWPILEQRGVKLQKKQPRRYEMTKEAKQGIGSIS